MIKSILLFIFCLPILAIGQDTLVPMSINPYLEDRVVTKSGGSSLDSTFIYEYDNLELPIFDDFSLNKWVKYVADFDGPNVMQDSFYYLIDPGPVQPFPSDAEFCDSNTTFHKTIIVENDTVVDSTRVNLTTGVSVFVQDLSQLPIMGELLTLYTECYTLIDTIFDGVLDPDQDTIYHEASFKQDSIRIFNADITSSDIWIDDFACHSYEFAVDPISLGVATFDGVSNDGNPYEFGNPSAYGRADVLTSKPINLAGKDDVYLSFWYQAKGNGNSPEAEDSLLLEMYAPTQDVWYPIWGVSGDEVDNEWSVVIEPVDATLFLNDGFQFRFANKATTSGALDHWHIDYVRLRENGEGDTVVSDVSIVYPIQSLLKDYTHVPWDHYNNLTNPLSEMRSDYDLIVRNSNSGNVNKGVGGLNIEGDLYQIPTAGTGPNAWETTNDGINVYTFGVNNSAGQPYSYPTNTALDKADFEIVMNIRSDGAQASANFSTENDTTYFTQSFRNFYAYDDGTAESGYGILDNNAQIAYKYDTYEADTLTGILMKFVPNVTDVSNNVILITVWEDNNGEPGEILYKDDFFMPHYPSQDGLKKQYSYFSFNDDQTVPVGTSFFIGFEQIDDQNLYLGFDLNTNSQNKIFYNTGGAWFNASFEGSLIMRPVFSTGLNHTLSVQPNLPEKVEFSMFPNPVNDILTVPDLPYQYSLQVFDITGKEVLMENANRIDFSNFSNGFYIVNVLDELGTSVYSKKIIKQ